MKERIWNNEGEVDKTGRLVRETSLWGKAGFVATSNDKTPLNDKNVYH